MAHKYIRGTSAPCRSWRPDYLGLTIALAQWARDAQQLSDEDLSLLAWHLLTRRDELVAALAQRRKEATR
jgi:hypothetical protein